MTGSAVLDLLTWLGITRMPEAFLSAQSRVYWLSLLAAGAIAGIVWVVQGERVAGPFKGNLLGYLFPVRWLTHPSAVLDYKIWAVNRIGEAVVAPVFISGATVTAWMLTGAGRAAGEPTPMTWPWLTAYVVIYALVWDLTFYLTHAARHKSAFLWAFHSVHHTARVLTPMTLFRGHLFEIWWVSVVINLTTGAATAGFLMVLPHTAPVEQLLAVNLVFYVFNLLGSNLRHSHVWLSYGPVLSYLLVSPAQHQIHHSRAPRHFDKNHGSMLAVWDWMFGTLYIPGEFEEIDYGVSPEADARHETLLATIVEPMRDAAVALGLRTAVAETGPTAES